MDCVKWFRSRAYYYLVSADNLVSFFKGKISCFYCIEHINDKFLNSDEIHLGFFLAFGQSIFFCIHLYSL